MNLMIFNYRDQPDPPEPSECPECGAYLIEDKRERTVDCEECGFHDEFDWDAYAERLEEDRWSDDPGLDVW